VTSLEREVAVEVDCIIYTGCIGNSGYGLDYDPDTKKTISAHRLAFKLANGYLPKVVMHLCDVPTCVNPLHLKGGTQSDNIKDCVAKGRYPFTRRSLNQEQVLFIYDSSETQRKLASLFDVDQKTVYNIKHGLCYKEYTGHGGSCGV